MKLLRVLIIFSFIALSACAERHREGDPGRTADEIGQFIAEMSKDPEALASTDVQTAIAMAKDTNTSIYYAESNSSGTAAMGKFDVVAPVNLDAFGFNVTISQLSEIKIFFLQKYVPGGVEYALLIQATDQSNVRHYEALRNDSTTTDLDPAAFSDSEFVVTFHSPNSAIGLLTVKSDDVTDGKLQQNIQLQIISQDSSGAISPEGQISTLFGFL